MNKDIYGDFQICISLPLNKMIATVVGNNAKGRISKRVFQQNKARQSGSKK